MQLHIPDPAHTGSERARANFWLALKMSLGFVALIWIIQLLNWGAGIWRPRISLGWPRQLAGCPAFFSHSSGVHGGFGHLIKLPAIAGNVSWHGNVVALYPSAARRVLKPAVYFGN